MNWDCGKYDWYNGMTGGTGLTADGLEKDNFNFGSFFEPGAQHWSLHFGVQMDLQSSGHFKGLKQHSVGQ